MNDFAGRLVAVMKEKGLKNPAVAEALGVHPGTVSKWRSGLQIPDEGQMAKLAKYLGRSAGWLRYGDVSVQPGTGELSAEGFTPTGEVSPGVVRERAEGWVEFAKTRHARNLPLAVREYLAEFQLRLVKGGATEDEIDEAMALLRSPDVFSYFKGGQLAEYNEQDVLDGMRSLAEDVVIPRLQKLGRKVK